MRWAVKDTEEMVGSRTVDRSEAVGLLESILDR